MTRRLYFIGIMALAAMVSMICAIPVQADPDKYLGDTVIYTGAATHNKPYVLLIVDNSAATLNKASGASYDHTHNYSAECVAAVGASNCFDTFGIYKAGQQGTFTHSALITGATGTLNTATTSGRLDDLVCQATGTIRNSLLGTVGQKTTGGTYQGSATDANPNLKAQGGEVRCDTTGQGAAFALGNFLNYTMVPPPPSLVQGSDGKDYKVIQSHTSSRLNNYPITGSRWTEFWVLYSDTHSPSVPLWQEGMAYDTGSNTQQKVIYDALSTVVSGARHAVNFGAMIYGAANKGGKLIAPIKDVSADADFNAFLATLPTTTGAVLNSNTARPQAEALYDAYEYFKGASSPGIATGSFTPPFSSLYCGRLYVVLVTNGLPNGESAQTQLESIGDYDHDGREPNFSGAAYGAGTHYLDDVAKKMYQVGVPNEDNNGVPVIQNIRTNVILAFQADDSLMQRTADANHGNGAYQVVNNAQQLAKALNEMLNSIMLEADTSFVAPVVPVSPENRTYSGNRIYMGLFKPISQKPWLGNLKKYGVDPVTNVVMDINNNAATNSDGSFLSSSRSYWLPVSAAADAGDVDKGGVGQLLAARDLTGSPRKIYTYNGSTTTLSDSSNAFITTNITPAQLGVGTDGERDAIVKFVTGFDVYDDNENGSTTDKRDWIMGDILHSKPVVVHYQAYVPAAEGDCGLNKSLVYVGANDGMLHAFKDCDGQEAWAFIPPDLLPRLQHIHGLTHTYFVDSSPSVYVYDANKNGNIEAGDKVILMFGERRGGGSAAHPADGNYGYYYALDVTDPATPKYLWSINGATTGSYPELAETWSEPKIVKMQTGAGPKVVAIIGAGYDNLNEDNRYGANQDFNGSGFIYSTDMGDLPGAAGTSAGASAPLNPKGRGVYAVELASLNGSGVPTITTTATKVWGYTTGNNFSIPSEVAAIDTDSNGFVDRIYVGDTGGNIYRLKQDVTSFAWDLKHIFYLNTDTSKGRKIFYKPSVSLDVSGSARLYIGSGDREHPLNQVVVDRIYGLWDKGQAVAKLETDMIDVTNDELQLTNTDVSGILTTISGGSGWYIRLEGTGEKALAPPLLFNEVAYYTTFAPTIGLEDPCQPGNLGTGSVYAVNYLTGEAAVDYYAGNNDQYENLYGSNRRATGGEGIVLQKEDRKVTLPPGIPSGLVLVINANGEIGGLIGAGGALFTPPVRAGGTILPLYWRMR